MKGIICQGPLRNKDQCFVLTHDWIHSPRTLDPQPAIAELLRRYVVSHGPVPIADFLWWTKLLKREIAAAEVELRPEFEILEIDGVEHWVAPEVLSAYPGLKRKTTPPYWFLDSTKLCLATAIGGLWLPRSRKPRSCPAPTAYSVQRR
ncbi:winged helix DNA-binding domain-containing protein [Ornithinimicrobium sp. INDO-MA30-4]|uniref:winged helix DNA-binding domain-containing protein n=1 Tax=Ornithinimicrobium sp. INDO-MA30-4 TaxID=2908651 RepID=UPI0021A2F7DD|nr:winged helix DNA-binding domain-containing protein [Ornithinimicrobium sp. INDO-MA30-4]